MTRWLGAALVAGCGLWLGLQRTLWYVRRVELLGELLAALSLMEWELKNREPPMCELLRRVGETTRRELRAFFEACVRQMNDLGAQPFGVIWQEAAEQAALPLSREELTLVQGLGQVLGRYDGESQQRAIAQCRTQLTARLEGAREERDRLGRLSGVLGGAAGLLAVILLL